MKLLIFVRSNFLLILLICVTLDTRVYIRDLPLLRTDQNLKSKLKSLMAGWKLLFCTVDISIECC